MYDLIFANAQLENRFRRAMDSDHEIGGFLFCKYGFQGLAHARELRRLTKLPDWRQLLTIHSWMEVPNDSPDSEHFWKPWDVGKAHAVARRTAISLCCPWELHFHTHPAGASKHPSNLDMAYWASNCPLGSGTSLAALVTLAPLRVTAYELHLKTAGVAPIQAELVAGHFYS